MQVPLEITFHGLDRSEALEADVRRQASKLEEFSDRLTSCHVVLEKPHRHHRQGNTYHVRIRVAVPRRELVVIANRRTITLMKIHTSRFATRSRRCEGKSRTM